MKKIEAYRLAGMVKTIPIPPANALAISKEMFIERVNPIGESFFRYKSIIGIEPLI